MFFSIFNLAIWFGSEEIVILTKPSKSKRKVKNMWFRYFWISWGEQAAQRGQCSVWCKGGLSPVQCETWDIIYDVALCEWGTSGSACAGDVLRHSIENYNSSKRLYTMFEIIEIPQYKRQLLSWINDLSHLTLCDYYYYLNGTQYS